MKFSDAKKGRRVIYVRADRQGDRQDNPLWNGNYGRVVGTVEGFRKDNDYPVIVKWDNGTKNNYRLESLDPYTPKLELLRKWIKPYEKYIGFIALAAVIDHFVLGGKFTSRFKELGESLVKRIVDAIDRVIDRIIPSN